MLCSKQGLYELTGQFHYLSQMLEDGMSLFLQFDKSEIIGVSIAKHC